MEKLKLRLTQPSLVLAWVKLDKGFMKLNYLGLGLLNVSRNYQTRPFRVLQYNNSKDWASTK
jgi:hypothetical protein